MQSEYIEFLQSEERETSPEQRDWEQRDRRRCRHGNKRLRMTLPQRLNGRVGDGDGRPRGSWGAAEQKQTKKRTLYFEYKGATPRPERSFKRDTELDS